MKKNRNRSKYTFANINLLGNCNADCFFCLGKDISKELRNKNHLFIHYSQLKNFNIFLEQCKKYNIKKLYLTGQTADGLQYKYLNELINYLKSNNFIIGVRTNGYLALQKIDSILQMNGEIGYSIHSLKPDINKKIMGIEKIPNWDLIIPHSGDNVRISIVINDYNLHEIYDIIKYVSKFDNVKYIQLRRISTDTRYESLKNDIEIFEFFYKQFISNNKKKNEYESAPIYNIYGKDIIFWRTIETTANSLNYFTDGIISDEYFIVEGYLKYLNKPEVSCLEKEQS